FPIRRSKVNIHTAIPRSTTATTITTELILPEANIVSCNQPGAPDAAKVLTGRAVRAMKAARGLTIVSFIEEGSKAGSAAVQGVGPNTEQDPADHRRVEHGAQAAVQVI